MDVQINYDEFPYPLERIRGMHHGRWRSLDVHRPRVRRLRTIRGEGFLAARPSGTELWLRFTGQNVPLDARLFDALREPVQAAWKQLRPTRRDRSDGRGPASNRPRRAEYCRRASSRAPESAQLRPEFFDYLMDYVAGAIHYQDGRVRARRRQRPARCARTSPPTARVVFSPDGGWQFQLVGLWADRISPRAPTCSRAMPERLSRLIDQLRANRQLQLHQRRAVVPQSRRRRSLRWKRLGRAARLSSGRSAAAASTCKIFMARCG